MADDIHRMLFTPPRDDVRPTWRMPSETRAHRREEIEMNEYYYEVETRRPGPSRAAVLRAEIARQQAELVALEAAPDVEAMPEGAVLRFVRRLPVAGANWDGPALTATQDFTYVAVKAGRRWYTTATQRDTKVMGSGALRDMLADPSTVLVERPTSWEQLAAQSPEDPS